MTKSISTNHSVVVMSALRYMLGRSSYGVGCVCDYITDNINNFTNSNKKVMDRDIQKHLDLFPNTAYKDDWIKLKKLLNK